MKTKFFVLMIGAIGLIVMPSCKKRGCMDSTAENYDAEAEKDNGSCTYKTSGNVTLDFTFNVNGTNITSSDFDQLNYTNLDGNTWSITKMQYLISDVRFYRANGDSVMLEGYHLIDMEDSTSLSYVLPDSVKFNPYTGIGFNYGFEPADNTDGAYTDLNAASWSSPTMLGGGYHQMKFEGRFIDAVPDTVGFQYHNLSTIRQINGVDTTFHENYSWIKIPQSFNFTGNTNIEIKMDINQWFQTPNTWDLDTLNSMLMPNYSAQVMMKENSYSVFTVGSVTTE